MSACPYLFSPGGRGKEKSNEDVSAVRSRLEVGWRKVGVRGGGCGGSELAVIKLVEAARMCRGDLVVVATGPLTNLALACKLEPDLPSLIKEVYVMGGAEARGNITPSAEFNFHCDPEAAHLVLRKFPHVVRPSNNDRCS